MSQCHRKIYLASSSMLEPAALLGFSSLCSTTLGQTWQAIKWKKKINLFPLHLFKKLLICCLPMKGSPLTEGPIGRHCSCETPANPWLHSNAAHLFHGDTSFSDPTYLWCVRKDNTEICVWGQSCAGLQIWDYRRAQELRGKSEVLTCFSAASWCGGHFGKGREFLF